eukprot:COSAG06_NODE_294_length_18179_cov_25.675830_9_plen_78_part_00
MQERGQAETIGCVRVACMVYVCVYTYAMCVVRCGVVQHLPFIFPEVRRRAVSLCNTITATAAATTTAAAAANVFDPV